MTSVAITTLLAPREAIMYIAAVNITLQVRKSLAALRGACAYMAVVSTALQVRKRLAALQVRRRSPVGGTARSDYVHVGVRHHDASATVLGGTATYGTTLQVRQRPAPLREACVHMAVYSTTLQVRQRLAVLQVRRLSAALRRATACTSVYSTTML